MMRVVLVVPATIMACADRMLRHWHRMNDMGGGLIMGVLLILVILTGCTPY